MAWFKPKVVYGLSPEVAVVVVEESPRWLGLSTRWFMFLSPDVAVVVGEESPRWLGLSPKWFMF